MSARELMPSADVEATAGYGSISLPSLRAILVEVGSIHTADSATRWNAMSWTTSVGSAEMSAPMPLRLRLAGETGEAAIMVCASNEGV